MRKFLETNFKIILLVLFVITLLKGCNDSRELKKIKNEIVQIKTNTYTKDELGNELRIMGLESEKRMIQSTDRKILDVKRQTEIDAEITEIRSWKKGK